MSKAGEHKRPNCTRIRICKICPFKGSKFENNKTDQDDYHRDAMLAIAHEGDSVWTCLHHLHNDKSMRAQCHIGAKELVKAKNYIESQKPPLQIISKPIS